MEICFIIVFVLVFEQILYETWQYQGTDLLKPNNYLLRSKQKEKMC